MTTGHERTLYDRFWAHLGPLRDDGAAVRAFGHGPSDSEHRQNGGGPRWGGENLFDDRTSAETPAISF